MKCLHRSVFASCTAIVLSSLITGSHAITTSQQEGLCVIGSTPFVDPSKPNHGIQKYWKLVEEMALKCKVMVHVGNTKPGKLPCNKDLMTKSVRYMIDQGSETGAMVLYTPGDNELSDCHRHASAVMEKQKYSDILRAPDARDFLIQDLQLNRDKDLTGNHDVTNHDMIDRINPATCDRSSESNDNSSCKPYHCDFDKYVEVDNYAIATLEVLGSHWYLDDARKHKSPYQDEVDPLQDRLAMYINAKDCALEWIEYAAQTAFANNKRAVFFLLHARFYENKRVMEPLSNQGIGKYYNAKNLFRNTSALLGSDSAITLPYQPLFDKLNETAFQYPSLFFQVVHASDEGAASSPQHFFTARLLSDINNRDETIRTHHNVMIHQVEGHSRALTMYSKFTVSSDDAFQPVTLKQEWSRSAYNEVPEGHTSVGLLR